MKEDEDHELWSVDNCQRRNDLSKWKDTIQSKLDLLAKRKVFGPVVQTLKGISNCRKDIS